MLFCQAYLCRGRDFGRDKRRVAITAFQVVPANGQHLDSHPEAVTHGADLRTMVVRPLDGYLNCAQLELIGQEQQLRIETPALDVLTGKHDLGSVSCEGLEAALRVAILQPQNDTEGEVEQASVELAVPRLSFCLQ